MTANAWLGTTGIGGIYTAVEGKHDGYAEVYIEATLNSTGERRLQEFLVSKVKDIEEICIIGHTIKVIAKRRDGKTLNKAELKKLASSTIKAVKTWAERQDQGDLTFILSTHSQQRVQEAMATSSTTRPYGSSENNSWIY